MAHDDAVAQGHTQILEPSERILEEARPPLRGGALVGIADTVDLDDAVEIGFVRSTDRQRHRPRVSKKVHG